MLEDVGQQLTVPPEIAVTSLRPDVFLWSNAKHRVYFIELTVHWEDAVQKGFERKKQTYSELAAEQQGCSLKLYPVEAGCLGFVTTSTIRLMRDQGNTGQTLYLAT